LLNSGGHFSFDIADAVDPNFLDKTANTLVNFLLEQLLETIGSEVVEEHLAVALIRFL